MRLLRIPIQMRDSQHLSSALVVGRNLKVSGPDSGTYLSCKLPGAPSNGLPTEADADIVSNTKTKAFLFSRLRSEFEDPNIPRWHLRLEATKIDLIPYEYSTNPGALWDLP
jgi:hypothetical protein